MATAKIVKCANCEVVISELLTFIQNKIEVMDEVSLQRICATSFSAEEITEAKVLLFESIPTTARKVTRKGGGKAQRDIEDMICLFKESEPDVIPIFVARNLNKLPPVTFDYVDASKLLKDIVMLRAEITSLRNSCATVEQMSQIKNDLDNLRSASLVNNFGYVNNKRGAYLLNDSMCDSGPMGFLPQARDESFQYESSFTVRNDNKNPLKKLPSNAQNVINTAQKVEPTAIGSDSTDVPILMTSHDTGLRVGMDAQLTDSMHRSPLSTASACDKGHVTLDNSNNVVMNHMDGEHSVNKQKRKEKENEWKVVEKKKKNRSYTNKTGCANNAKNFKAADSKVPILITNVHRETKEQDIINHIKENTGEQVSLIKLSQRIERGYYSFKFFVPKYKLNLFLEESLWPKGIIFRRFIHYNVDRGLNVDNKKKNG